MADQAPPAYDAANAKGNPNNIPMGHIHENNAQGPYPPQGPHGPHGPQNGPHGPGPNGPMQGGEPVQPLHMLGDGPQWIWCPFCNSRTQTRVRKEGTGMQVVTGAVLCFICFLLTPLPCIMGWFENTDWNCTKCNALVASRSSDGPIHVYSPNGGPSHGGPPPGR